MSSQLSEPYKSLLSLGSVLLVLGLLFHLCFAQLDHSWNWAGVLPYWPKLLQGWWTTMGLSLAAMGLSLLVGLLAALARIQSFLPLRHLSLIYTEIIRGTPLLVQILLFFYVVADAVGLQNRYVAGVLILSLFSGAYLAEIIRAGIGSVGESQLESARAIGLSPVQIYQHVIFPQALRHSLPAMAGQFVSLIKDSSLLSIISISEITLNAQEINSFSYSTLESYLPLALGYLLLTLPLTWWSRQLEKRFAYET
ncbi:MAG: amino acid ABC transporter permease [Blastochloris sp.]|nr:amino acid ABC transporter permease [Blastochloris sp.]